jgi:hypothetical protein
MPKPNIAVYDSGPHDFDRYTVYYLDEVNPRTGGTALIGMSEHPFHPQGFGQHGEGKPGPHNGSRIELKDLPIDCQKLVEQELQLLEYISPEDLNLKVLKEINQ